MQTSPNASAEARTLAYYTAMAAEAMAMAWAPDTHRHTPGPWTWHGRSLRPEQPAPDVSAVHTILEAEGGCGYFCSNVHETCAEIDADMAVIAAAPELLNALRMLAWHTQQLLDASDVGPAIDDRRSYIAISLQVAHAAMAKAAPA